MIIKSMARKSFSFRQLAEYLHKDGTDGAILCHNVLSEPGDVSAIATEFECNARNMPPRANGNQLYHELISLPPGEAVSLNRQCEILLDLGRTYLERRAGRQMAYGRIHSDDTDHPHLHLMISANPVASRKRVRLTKAAFADIQRDVEAYKADRYPELTDEPIYDREHRKARVSQREYEMTRRTGKPSRKQQARDAIAAAFTTSTSHDELEAALAASGFALYRRGRTFGVRQDESDLRFRLKTLGLDREYSLFADRTLAREERQAELDTLRSLRHRDAERDA